MPEPWLCRWIGHWWRRGKVIAGPYIHIADYRKCRVCGLYEETRIGGRPKDGE